MLNMQQVNVCLDTTEAWKVKQWKLSSLPPQSQNNIQAENRGNSTTDLHREEKKKYMYLNDYLPVILIISLLYSYKHSLRL